MSGTNSGLSGSHVGTTSDSIGGIPNNTSTADPSAVQSAASGGPSSNKTPQHGPAVSTTANNVDRVSAADTKSSGGGGGGGIGSAVKDIAAGVHGAGEKIRGKFNSGVDEAANEPAGVAKNNSIANAGDNEMATGKFAASTKNREGMLPGGDHGKRHAQANDDLNRE